MIYDYVIILCPSALNSEGKFDELSSDGSYLGGQTRMQAAVDLYKSDKVKNLIVVGGGIDEQNQRKKWRKVNDMRKFLMNNNIPPENIIRISSKADTHGNLRAVYKTFRDKLKNKSVGILTNFYHLPRTMRFTYDSQFKWENVFIPICAESVIKSMPLTYLQRIPELLLRIANDIKGIKDWEEGKYTGQDDEPWKGEIYLKDRKIFS